MLVLAVLFAFIYCCTSFFGMFVQFEDLSYAAKTVARQIEVTGKYDDATIQTNIATVLDNPNIVGGNSQHGGWYTISVGADNETKDNALRQRLVNQHKLQLKQKFTLTLYGTYNLHLIGSRNGNLMTGWTIKVPLTYSVTGMSEVYQK